MRGYLLSVLVAALLPMHAFAHPVLNNENFKKLDLKDFQLIEQKSRENSFAYQVKRVARPSSKLVAQLEAEAVSKVVSPVFQLNEKSAFKNIYVWVAQKEDGLYEFCTLYINKSKSVYLVDIDIVDGTDTELMLKHGSFESYEVKTGRPLFPN